MEYDVEVLKGGNVLIRAGNDKTAEEIANEIRSYLDSNNSESNTKEAEPNIGDVDEYGWIYAGRSVEDNQKLWVSPKDTEKELTWFNANEYTKSLQKQFKDAGRNCNVSVPTIEELKEINNLVTNSCRGALLDTFNENTSYWSSSEDDNGFACLQRFTDGYQYYGTKASNRFVRCVRRDLDI